MLNTSWILVLFSLSVGSVRYLPLLSIGTVCGRGLRPGELVAYAIIHILGRNVGLCNGQLPGFLSGVLFTIGPHANGRHIVPLAFW